MTRAVVSFEWVNYCEVSEVNPEECLGLRVQGVTAKSWFRVWAGVRLHHSSSPAVSRTTTTFPETKALDDVSLTCSN